MTTEVVVRKKYEALSPLMEPDVADLADLRLRSHFASAMSVSTIIATSASKLT